jgi:hypothetical protein
MCISGCTPNSPDKTERERVEMPDWANLPEGFAGGMTSDGWWAVNCPEGSSPVVYDTAVEGSLDFDAELAGRGIARGSVSGGSQFEGRHVRCEN